MQHSILCCLIAACTVSAAHAGQKVVLYGDDDYAPYSYVERGQFKGMYVDILTKAAKKLAPAYALELVPAPWKRGLAELESGSGFGLFPPGLKKERTYIDPYSVVLYRETVVLFCNEQVMQVPRRIFPDDFSGLTVGVNAGFLLSARLMDASRAGKIKLAETKGNESNLKKLALKRIDCYASDRGAALHTLKKLQADPDLAGLKLQEAVELSGENTYIGYSVNNNAAYKADFIAKMNAVLEEMRKNGDTAAIEDSYLKE